MTRPDRGRAIFAEELFAEKLSRFAAAVPDPRLTDIAERCAAPLAVAVSGRRGVGRRTVARVLGQAGLVIASERDADVAVYVVAEVVKPEDSAAVVALAQPVLVVLNKADVIGYADTAGVSAQLGVPVLTMSALRRSGIDAVLRQVGSLGAPLRYQRVSDAVVCLEALSVSGGNGERIAAFLARDATVLARMAAAIDVIEAAGLSVEGTDGPAGDCAAHLRRAVRWQRYSRGPGAALHRACGADIARGSLRLWLRDGGRRDRT